MYKRQASISGYLETLLDGALDDKEVNKTFLKRSLKNIKRLEVLVTDLVDISRIETGELIMNMSQVDILTLIEEMVSDANSTKKNSKIDIKINNNLNEKVFLNAI